MALINSLIARRVLASERIFMIEAEEAKLRRVPTTFNVRTDLLNRLDKRVPAGQRSRFLEGILIRELVEEGTAKVQA